MKLHKAKLAMTLAAALTYSAQSSAADIDYPQSGPIFSEAAYLVGGIGEIDTFYFTVATAGTYHFYSTSAIDTYGYIYSDSNLQTLASNDDGGSSLNFCVQANLLAGENISIVVEGYALSTEGDYTVVGAAGDCASSGLSFFNSGRAAPSAYTANPNVHSAPASDSGSLGLPALLLSLFGLAAARLRRKD